MMAVTVAGSSIGSSFPVSREVSFVLAGAAPCKEGSARTTRCAEDVRETSQKPDSVCWSLLDDRKSLSVVTALEIQRIVIGGVEMNDLARA
jgi:hypothetical protein